MCADNDVRIPHANAIMHGRVHVQTNEYKLVCACSWEREREREMERETQRERHRERDRQTERQRDREKVAVRADHERLLLVLCSLPCGSQHLNVPHEIVLRLSHPFLRRECCDGSPQPCIVVIIPAKWTKNEQESTLFPQHVRALHIRTCTNECAPHDARA